MNECKHSLIEFGGQIMNELVGNKISLNEARKFLITYHGLNHYANNEGENSVLEYFKKVGCIQYDPLNVVGRNADLVLQSRIKNYKSSILNDLLYEKRALIDGWDKMMAIYLQSDWPYFSRVRKECGKDLKGVLTHRNASKALEYLEEVKNIVIESGPLQSNKIDIGSNNPGSWGHRKLSSATLDYLYTIGEIGVYKKINTQKVYDIIENLLPSDLLNQEEPFELDEMFYEWYVKRRIGSIGMLWSRNGSAWLGHFISNSKIRNNAIKALIEKEEIKEIYVDDIKYPFYIRNEDLNLLNEIADSDKKEMKFLAPLDNLLWDRTMIKSIFDFDYSWEVYVPVPKRKYGYYVLPVLYNNRFVARFEPELYRGEKELRIKEWWWEEDIEVTEELISALKEAFDQFCKYLGAEKVNDEDFQNKCLCHKSE